MSRHTPKKGNKQLTMVLAPLVLRAQLGTVSTSVTDRTKLTGVNKTSIPVLLRKLLNISCLKLLISVDTLLMTPAAGWGLKMVQAFSRKGLCEVLHRAMTLPVLTQQTAAVSSGEAVRKQLYCRDRQRAATC